MMRCRAIRWLHAGQLQGVAARQGWVQTYVLLSPYSQGTAAPTLCCAVTHCNRQPKVRQMTPHAPRRAALPQDVRW
jgi:hypothetical protein